MSYAKKCAQQRKRNQRAESKRKEAANRARACAKAWEYDHFADLAAHKFYSKLA